jgi:hypothetical protein
MTERLFIQIKDGQPIGHAVHPDNLRLLGVDPDGNLAELLVLGFAPYEFAAAPTLHPLENEQYDAPVLAVSGNWTRPRRAIAKPPAEQALVTAQWRDEASQVKASLLSISVERKDRAPLWGAYHQSLQALDVHADPFNVVWPRPPDQLPPMKVHRV